MATLYKLVDPETNEVKYIGVTRIKYLNSRLTVHIRKARLHLNSSRKVSDWIRDLLDKGLKPLIVPIMTVNDENRLEAEATMIQAFKLVGHPLLNTYKM